MTHADLRLRRRPRGHRAGRAPPAFNPTFREFGLPVDGREEEYGGKLADRRRQGADGQPARRPSSCAADGLPEDADGTGGRARRVAQAQDRDLHRHGRRRAAADAARHPPDHRRGAGRGLDPRRSHPRPPSRRSAPSWSRLWVPSVPPGSTSSSPATWCNTRSRLRTSICWPSSGSALPAAAMLVDRGLAQRPAGRRRRPGCACVMTVNGYTAEEDNSEAVLVVSSLGDPDGERTRSSRTAAAARPGRLHHPDRSGALPRARLAASSTGEGPPRRFAWQNRRSTTSTSSSGRWPTTIVDNGKYFAQLDSVVGDGDFGYSLRERLRGRSRRTATAWTRATIGALLRRSA